MVRCLTNADVEACLDMPATLSALETAYAADAAGRAVNIPRSDMLLPLGPDEAYVFKVMPGAVEDLGVAALRVQSDVIRWGDDRKVKVGRAGDGEYVQYVQVYDTETTEPILVFPDGYASKMRVGATNALGARCLADPDARVIGLLGAGRQAGGQVEAFDAVFDLDEIRVYSPTPANRESFAAEWDAGLDATVRPVDSARAAVAGADILACATNAMRPVFEADWIEPGMHVSAIKAPEVPEAAFAAVDRVGVHHHLNPTGQANYTPRGSDFADRLVDAWTVEGIDVLGVPDLASLIAADAGRDPGETTLFLNSIGLGMQFAALGRRIHDRAVEADLGVEVDGALFRQPMW